MEHSCEYTVIHNHPLVIDLVLETLSKYIPSRDLLRCRLVCKQWNRFLISRVRGEFQVRLGEASLGKYSSLSQFISLLLSSQKIPYGSYFLINQSMNNPLLEKVFSICGPHIRILRLQKMQFDIIDIYGLRKLLLQQAKNLELLSIDGSLPEEVSTLPDFFSSKSNPLCYQLPNLQEIQIQQGLEKMYLNFLQDLLRASPNLKTFRSNKSMDLDRSITAVISVLRDTANFKSLSSLHLNKLDNSHLASLIQFSKQGLRLKEFSFSYLEKNVEKDCLQAIIDLHRSSLRVLTMGEIEGSVNFAIEFPVMKNLRILSRSAIGKPEIYFGGICYATVTPNIEELEVQAFADELNWTEYFADVNMLYPCNSLRRLKLPINLADPLKLEKLGRMFPSITKVNCESPRNIVISALWTNWPELEDLSITLNEKNIKIDSVFTGIPEDTCELINSTKNFEEVEIETIRVGPSIANLRGLRKLHIECMPCLHLDDIYSEKKQNSFLTDISGYFGLAYLTNIEDISISNCEITDDCYLSLGNSFQPYAKICISSRNPVSLYAYDQFE